MNTALTIAGSDPSGGAGIQADLKTFQQHGIYGASVITLVTVQNSKGVSQISTLKPTLVRDQLKAVIDDISIDAAKIGALGNAEIAREIVALIEDCNFPLVVDTVFKSSNEYELIIENDIQSMIDIIFPKSTLITPNIHEAEHILKNKIQSISDMEDAAKQLQKMGPKSVLIKGGHLTQKEAIDLLYSDHKIFKFESPRIQTQQTHGTGCTLSAAITANLAAGQKLVDAVANAKRYITNALKTAPHLGGGQGPVNHHASI